MPWLLLPTIHEPKTSNRSIGPRRFAGTSRDAIFFPRLKTHIPPGDPGWKFPQAAKTLSCQENVAVITPGVWGRLTKTKFRPRRTSYVCKEYPTEVVIWNVDFPRRTHASGTGVGDTSPNVFNWRSMLVWKTLSYIRIGTYSEGRKYLGRRRPRFVRDIVRWQPLSLRKRLVRLIDFKGRHFLQHLYTYIGIEEHCNSEGW